MFFRLLGIASSPMEKSLNNSEGKGNGRNIDDITLSFNGHDVALKLDKLVTRTSIQYINAPRKKKGLLVLDLDHTLMDFSCRCDFMTEMLKRPYMDYFLTTVYAYYDIAIWSQTNWKWLELKLKELGMLKSNSYKICFALDKSNMFTVKHSYVKPLQLIWRKCSDLWGPHNTLHIDDLSKNFELNKSSGVLVTPFYLKMASTDTNGDGDAEIRNTENTKQKTSNNTTKLEQAQSAAPGIPITITIITITIIITIIKFRNTTVSKGRCGIIVTVKVLG
jgi:HAD-superfamily hydrolase (TIGR02245 family)